jgi:hypothetical protein
MARVNDQNSCSAYGPSDFDVRHSLAVSQMSFPRPSIIASMPASANPLAASLPTAKLTNKTAHRIKPPIHRIELSPPQQPALVCARTFHLFIGG